MKINPGLEKGSLHLGGNFPLVLFWKNSTMPRAGIYLDEFSSNNFPKAPPPPEEARGPQAQVSQDSWRPAALNELQCWLSTACFLMPRL